VSFLTVPPLIDLLLGKRGEDLLPKVRDWMTRRRAECGPRAVRRRIGQAMAASRRRTGKHTNHGAPGPTVWVTTRAWGRIG
jgi:hypothetical protein